MGELLYPSFCFIYPFVQQQARGMRMMKNLQNYAKNVQLVKRNIILCVASFYIASFPFLNWDNGGVRWRFGERKLRCCGGRLGKSENEREAMSIMKYILLKWRREEDFVDRK